MNNAPIATPAHTPAYAAPLAQQAEAIVQQALQAGASDADVVIREGDEFDATVRMGELESLKDSGSRGVGLRVFLAGADGARGVQHVFGFHPGGAGPPG